MTLVDIVRSGDVERRIALRAALLWLGVRTTVTVFTVLAGVTPWGIHTKSAVLTTALVGVLTTIDSRRNNEDIFLANLGTPRMFTPIIGGAVSLVLEIGFALSTASLI